MKLILSAAYFDIINKSFNIAYYIFYKQKKLREIWFCLYRYLAVNRELISLAEDLDVHIAMM
jgi:hypothetical protein